LDAATKAFKDNVSSTKRQLSKEGYTRSKHVRFLCKFCNGQENWAQADAVRPQAPIPVIQYVDREAHFEYLATYVDDILAFSRDPMTIIEDIKREATLFYNQHLSHSITTFGSLQANSPPKKH
jgi:hypothetical protein